SCLKFIKVRRLRGPGIVYYRGDGCYSVLGKLPTGQPQPISLTPKCWVYGIVEHETLHALGLDHEMSRRDRGKYITLHLGNAFDGFGEIVGYQPSFLTYNLKYDYGSVMHYNRVSSSVNGRITISTKNVHYLKTIGQTHAASFNDIKLLNLHYCNDICKRKLNCSNHGYTDPKNCNVCRCPTFFTGKLCRQLVKSQAGCPNQELKAIAQPKTLAIRGKKSCIIRITAPLRSRIRLRINISQFTLFKVCEPFKGLEVKFLNDKSVAGARFCGLDRNKIILSEGNTVILHYRGMRPIDKVNIVYQTAN
ncbi:Astacin-like metalloendopeptidase, partial [Strongyloides ratti]